MLASVFRRRSVRAHVRRRIVLLSLSVAFAASAAAQTGAPTASEPRGQWRDTWGKPAQETPGMKSNKGFSAMIHLVEKTEAERFIREWNETPTGHAPTLKPAERVHRGQSIVLLILYAGCSTKAEGPAPCSATMDVKTYDPDGKRLMEELDVAIARDLPAHPNIVQLSPITLQTDFEPSDAEGVYRYEIVLRNPERNANLVLSDTVLLGAEPTAP
jgi:hypothetical protein